MYGSLYKTPEKIKTKGRGSRGKLLTAYTLSKPFKPTTASKLGTNAGSSTHPVYFSNGVPVACNVSTDYFTQGSNTLVLDGGGAA